MCVCVHMCMYVYLLWYRNTISFSVTVLEYRNSSFLSLSPGDLDQLLQNTAMEECTFSIDTTIGKALEIDLATKSTRVKRDLSKSHSCTYVCIWGPQ